MAKIEHITNASGTNLKKYKLKHLSGGTEEDVELTFSPSEDYVAGTPFNEATINPIIDKVNYPYEIDEEIENNDRKVYFENEDGGKDLTYATLNGIDFDNLLASSFSTYTAIEDCYLYAYVGGSSGIQINGIVIVSTPAGVSGSVVAPLKKNDVVSTNPAISGARVYGIKR